MISERFPFSKFAAPVLALVCLLVLTACNDRQPPEFDDDERRQQTEARYNSVHEDVANSRTAADQQLDEARSQTAKTGEVGFPRIEVEELLDDDNDDE